VLNPAGRDGDVRSRRRVNAATWCIGETTLVREEAAHNQKHVMSPQKETRGPGGKETEAETGTTIPEVLQTTSIIVQKAGRP